MKAPFPFPLGKWSHARKSRTRLFPSPFASLSPLSLLCPPLSLVHSFSFPFAPKVLLLLPPLAATQKFSPLCGGKAVGAQGIVAALRAIGSRAKWQSCHYVTDCCNLFEHQNQKWMKSPSLAIRWLKNQLNKNPSIAKLGDFVQL